MLVSDMRLRMSSAEYLDWSMYYRRLQQRQELASKTGR